MISHDLALFSSTIRPGRRGRAESIFGSPAPAARGTHVSHGASLARTHARALARTGRGTLQLAGWLPPTTPWHDEIHCFLRGLGGTARGAGEHLRFARPSRQRNIAAGWLAATHHPLASLNPLFSSRISRERRPRRSTSSVRPP